MEVSGERVAVGAGRLHAGVNALDTLPREPAGELGEAGLSVGKDFVTELAALADEASVELQLREVEAERREGHGGTPGGAAPGQPCECGLSSPGSGREILSGLRGARFGEAPGA